MHRHIGKDGTVVAWLGLGQGGELVGVGFPVETASIYDDPTQRGAMSADELGGRVYHDVCPMLQWTEEVGGSKRVVYNHRDTMAVGYLRYTFKIQYVGIRIAEGLHEHHFRMGTDGCFQCNGVVHPDDGVGDALCGKGMGDEVVRTAIQIVGCYHMVARLKDVL